MAVLIITLMAVDSSTLCVWPISKDKAVMLLMYCFISKLLQYVSKFMHYSQHYCIAGFYKRLEFPTKYHIRRNIDNDFNLAIWRSCEDHQINLHHYRFIYTTSMVSLHTVLKTANLKYRQQYFEQIAKHNVRQ